MIDPKWMLEVQSILRGQLNREPTGAEVNNALKDPAVASVLLFSLHDMNAANIAAINTKSGATPAVANPVIKLN